MLLLISLFSTDKIILLAGAMEWFAIHVEETEVQKVQGIS
jgi:hypothetical protein